MIQVGDTLQAQHGTWNSPPATEAGYAYQWFRTDSHGNNPVSITTLSNANQLYAVQGIDLGNRLQVGVVATNAAGSSIMVFSAVSELVSSPFGGGTTIPGWDYGQAMPGWLRVDGVEVANWARLFEYLKAGFAGPGISLEATGACDILYDVDGTGTPDVYADPALDPAPWFDPTRPESAQFLGVMVNSIQVIPQESRTAAALPGPFGGATLSPITSSGMQIAVQATIMAASKSGADYGEEWLRGVLGDPECDVCGTSTVEFRKVCPPTDGSNDDLGYWISYGTGVTSEPNVTAQDALGCTTDISWTWTSTEAFLYKAPTTGLPAQIIAPGSYSGPCVDFETWLCGPGHYLDCFTVDPPNRGTWGTIITIISPDGVGEITIEAYDSCPPNLGVDTPASQLLITGVYGTLIIDSSQHLITYISPDGSEVRDGTEFVYVPTGQPLTWIEVRDCDQPRCVCIGTTHPCSEGYNTHAQIDLQYRRR